MYTHHEESDAVVAASAERVFALLDDHRRLSSHMNKSSWQMGGGKMETILDAKQGRGVGAHIVLRGRVFGIELHVEEVVVTYEPPTRKVWETIGMPRLLVIGPYRMSFEVNGSRGGSTLRVAIDYEPPAHGVARVLGWLFGRMYARWCTRRMVTDAARSLAFDAGYASLVG